MQTSIAMPLQNIIDKTNWEEELFEPETDDITAENTSSADNREWLQEEPGRKN